MTREPEPVGSAEQPRPERDAARAHHAFPVWITLLVVVVLVLAVLSLGLGQYPLSPATVLRVLAGRAAGTPAAGAVIFEIRLPRILAALLVGAALSASGAAYQTMLRNPLVSPEILGVASGSGFGACLAILLGLSPAILQVLTFVFGLLAAALALLIGRVVGSISPIVLVLGGIVVGAMFQALISATQFVANPDTTLPEITFWLFGSLARATTGGLAVPAIIVAVCLAVLFAVRWPLTVLATGEEQARTLGVDRRIVWAVVIAATTLMTATVVALAGVIGWVGLVVPHLARFVVGPVFGYLLAVSTLLGAGYLLLVDDLARTATAMDLPLGILTALVGAPFFVALLVKAGRQWL